MPTYLIPKDNGRLAIFSTISNRIEDDDLTDEEYISGMLESAVRRAYLSAVDDVREAHDPTVEREFDYQLARAIDEDTQRFEAQGTDEE